MTAATPLPTPPAMPAGDNPLNAFSQCHAGILDQLARFAELPALLEPAARARATATQVLAFFHKAVLEHHAEEERELFPAVLESAADAKERAQVKEIADRLTREHRQVEAVFAKLEPALKKVAKGQDATLGPEVAELVAAYRGHALYEEQVFLPLSQEILGRNAHHLAALGLSLHMRHVMPEVMARYGNRI